MQNVLIRGLLILAAIVAVVILYYGTLWVFALIGLAVPQNLLVAIFVLIALVAIVAALRGRLDTWFP